jgi:hypothetical protein
MIIIIQQIQLYVDQIIYLFDMYNQWMYDQNNCVLRLIFCLYLRINELNIQMNINGNLTSVK